LRGHHRWETILKIAGLEPMQGLLERKKQLENLSKLVEKEKNYFINSM
jgi:hypothetical protein